jgi:hypothetical protein
MAPYLSDSDPRPDPHENELQQRVFTAVLDLFAYTRTSAFSLPIPNTTPQLLVAAGEGETLRRLLEIEPPMETPAEPP